MSSSGFAADTLRRSSWLVFYTTWPPSTSASPLESFSISRRPLTKCGTPGRNFYVTVEGVTLGPRPISVGVSQGSCLSPYLYAVFTDNIPTLADQLQDKRKASCWHYMQTIYARISYHLVGPNFLWVKLQRVLDLLPDWLDSWRIAVNVTKTTALLTGQQRTMLPKLRLRGQEVEWKTRVRYLGV
ncbi:RNA-directed DNA polymerase from mobile element jockey [Eumeta japonica]|uniref:RNA-directed DNA polymerase from mobile element jockey n=1 Tax=Eumeta variegata TaxID=151549 RepID=A0A4C1VTF5_EUMVA|nr:RNA-directed DNA polymerase from mobile element jockey [Eumeta japonica]